MDIVSRLWDILFPIECINCGKDGSWLCRDCLSLLEENAGNKKINKGTRRLDGVFILFDYEYALASDMIKALKYKFIKEAGIILGNLCAQALKKDLRIVKNTFLVPVPLSGHRKRWRGFNQSALIAEQLSYKLNTPLINGLKRVKDKRPQAKLSKDKRLENIKNCFEWKERSLAGKNIILVDDVMTTGATLEECARVLKDAEAEKVEAVAIARGRIK